MDLLLQPGKVTSLSREMLIVAPPEPQPPIRTAENILSSIELESAVLDVDGRVPSGDRFAGHAVAASPWRTDIPQELVATNRAAKALTVWRWRDEIISDVEMQMSLEKGGRDLLGTVYHLGRA